MCLSPPESLLARRPESLLCALPWSLCSAGEDVMAAALMWTEMINEFTHSEELILSLLELFTSRHGRLVSAVAPFSFLHSIYMLLAC